MNITRPAIAVETRHQRELHKRMSGPQRHRLLQGYPMPPLMAPYDSAAPFEPVELDQNRSLIVGILPHAACAPSVSGCGYCTFPQEQFRATQVRQTVEAVIDEVAHTELRGRRVTALYYGGGTANLTPPDLFARLHQTAKRVFDLEGAEVSLEGAPAFFSEKLLDQVAPERGRISMGVQTFDEAMLEKMGRSAMGGPERVVRAVRAAQARQMKTSADLMINLPGQSLRQMLADVERAAKLEIDQLCVYHLVMFRGLGTPWSRDRDLLASLPDNEAAYHNWLAVRQRVQELGYQQKTLTNFERRPSYIYENCSYQPERFDGVGFGPAGLSTFTDAANGTAVKWMNAPVSEDYLKLMADHGSARVKCFVYGATDLRLLHLTRTLPRLALDRPLYQARFGSDLVNDFRIQFEALQQAGLVGINTERVELTPRGMFFADSVAGLLAGDRVKALRLGGIPNVNDPPYFHMG